MRHHLPTHGLHSLSASVKHTPVFRVPAPLRFIIGVLNSTLLQRALYMRVCQLGLTSASAQPKERWREGVLVDVRRQVRHAILRLVPAQAGG